jgi:hypothetical protein
VRLGPSTPGDYVRAWALVPRNPGVTQVLCPNPIDGPTTKPTTPLVPLINQLRVSHSTLVVALLSRVVTPQTGPYGEALRKQSEPPKVTTRTSSG